MINIFCIYVRDSCTDTLNTFCFKNKVLKQLKFIDSLSEQDAWEELLRKYGDQNGWLLHSKTQKT